MQWSPRLPWLVNNIAMAVPAGDEFHLKSCSGCVGSHWGHYLLIHRGMAEGILIIEDDKRLGSTVKKGLEEHGYKVSLTDSGGAALETLKDTPPDLVILDLGLPDCDGVNLLQELRERGCDAPLIIVTARDTIPEKVRGLDAGAEDYLVKPFAFPELLARLRALLRRSGRDGHRLVAGDISIDLITRHVRVGDESVDLSPREFDLLAYLARNAGQIVSREMLVKDVWREPSRQTSLDNVIDVHVSRLRRKINDNAGPGRLQVIRGVGIMLT